MSTASRPMNGRVLDSGSSHTLRLYGLTIILTGVATCSIVLLRAAPPDIIHLLVWLAAFLVADIMWFKTPSGRGTVSMASSLHIAAVAVLIPSEILPAAFIARLIANITAQRRSWRRALFNGVQLSLAVLAASAAHHWAADLIGGRDFRHPIFGPAATLIVTALSYYVVNTGLVCGFLAIADGDGLFKTWRVNFGYRAGILGSMALFLLAPAVLMAWDVMNVIGLAIFFIPIWFIRDNWRENVELSTMNEALVNSARMAATGEMAASVGKKLNNYVSFMSANLRVLELNGDQMSPELRKVQLERLEAQVGHMANLSHGLMDSSLLESRPYATDIFALVKDTTDLIRCQELFKDISISEVYDPRGGMINADSTQIQQVVMELFMNAAQSMVGTDSERKIGVELWWPVPGRELLLTVEDSGPGIREDLRARVLEPGFADRPGGNGFGLSFIHRIVENHGGAIRVEESRLGGAEFQILFRNQAAKSETETAA